MCKNVIFYFSGTGNCLRVAKEIAGELKNCELIKIGKEEDFRLYSGYKRVGFVYPTYCWGPPLQVEKFISKLNLEKCGEAYYFAVATMGLAPGNAISSIGKILARKGRTLHYGTGIKMFSNYVALYDMKENVEEITLESNQKMRSIVDDIKHGRRKRISTPNPLIGVIHEQMIKGMADKDRGYQVSEDCISCGICEKVCPVQNICLEDGKPTFLHHCEHCMACIQYCPKRAINYKELTQHRRRYTHPEIDVKEMYSK